MAQTAFSIRMDEDLKRDFSEFCNDIGMSMTTAFVVFAKACLREGRIPFEIGTKRCGRKFADANAPSEADGEIVEV